MRKNYVLDTNVLIQSPNALEAFEENQIVIPMVVVEELDKLKNAEGEKGRNVRESIRLLEMLRQKGDLCQGVELGNGGLVRIEMNYINVELPEDLPDYKMDHRILKVCKGLKEEKKNEKVILVTKDILLRIKAQALGILSEDFQTEQVPKEPSQYTGRREVYAPEELFKDFKKKGMDPKEVYQVDEEGNKLEVFLEINEFLIIKADQSNKKTQLGRFNGKKIVMRKSVSRTRWS